MFAGMFAAAGWSRSTAAANVAAVTCDYSGYYGVFADIHDGDMKKVRLSADSKTVTIEPYNNTQTWAVTAPWSTVSCNASVNFNVPGKPNPPPVPLTMNYYASYGGSGQPTLRTQVRCYLDMASGLAPRALRTLACASSTAASQVFNDPSGTLAKPDFPLNTWIMISSGPL